MKSYVHHIPGRLRIRSAQVKRNPVAASAARSQLLAVEGVQGVDISTVTGSIVIHYDAAVVAGGRLLTLLDAHDCAGETTPSTPFADLGGPIIQKAASVLVDKLIERSALALIAALI